jgi:hypothetical protein
MNNVFVEFNERDSKSKKLDWTDTDIAYLKSPKSIRRLEQATFHHIGPVDIHIHTGVSPFGVDRERTAKQIRKNDRAVFFYYSNANGPKTKKMLTPWIAAHRVMHAIQASRVDFAGQQGDAIFNPFAAAIRKLLAAYEFSVNPHTKLYYLQWDNDSLKHPAITAKAPADLTKYPSEVTKDLAQELFYQVLTMRSARKRGWPFVEELAAETFAQYLITGKVTLNELPESVQINGGIVAQKVNDLTAEEVEVDINRAYATVTERMPGNVFRF